MTSAPAIQPGPALAAGYKLDRYELLLPIAEGGMASVWVARQRGKHGFEKLVAIKTILPKFAADPRFQSMFLDEARIASRIEHVNVAQIFDLGEEHDVLYLAMEYVDGDALSKLHRACQRKETTVPAGIALRVLADTCAGLHEAHELKDGGRSLDIVHRDVSPHNILISTRGVAKLIDFGIAKARSRVGNDTNSGVLKGKIQYMAPEQALGRPVDRRADVWAIGAIAYHLFAGRPAYEADNQLATLHLLGSGRPPVPLPDAVHPSVRAIVRRALAHAPEGRYATAAAMREAIEDAMIEAMVPTTTSDVAAFVAEHLGERIDRRRQAVEAALAAAAERRKLEALEGDRSSTALLSSPSISGTQPVPPPSSSALSLDAKAPPASAPRASASDLVAKLTPRVSEPPPPGSVSSATLGSAALDASPPLSQPPPPSRRGVAALVAFVGVLGVAAALGAFAMGRTRARPPAPAPAVAAPPPPPVASAAPAAVDSSAGAAPSASAAASGIPIISASSLPHADQAPAWTPPPRWTPPPVVAAPAPPPPPAAPSATPQPPPRKKTVDDGF